jgi:methylmalonyl-CoA/ethylmalonyl-CoA epimerase
MHQELAGALGVIALDHTAIAVRDIDAALPLYRDLLGGQPLGSGKPQRSPKHGFQTVALDYPNGSKIELLAPIDEEGFIYRFLEKRGEGVHHLTFRVGDVRLAVARARQAGLRVVDENYADPRWQEAFISPRSAFGTIVQLAQTSSERPRAEQHLTGRLVG